MNILAPSILSADFMELGTQIKEAEAAGMKYIHYDVMDGIFVPSISFGMPVLASVRKKTDKFLDVHMMVTKPERYVEDFKNAGADGITIHVEACDCIADTLHKIRSLGCRSGLAVNPETSEEKLRPYLSMVDMLLVMTVHPGFGGQKYIEECTGKIERVRQMIRESGYDIDLEIDGGINRDNIKRTVNAGANIIVAGSAVFKGNITENVQYFNEQLR